MNSANEIEEYAKTIFRKCEIAFSSNSSNAERQQASLFLQNVGENDARFLYIIERVLKLTDKPEVLILFANLGLKTITKFWGSLEKDFLLNFRSLIVNHLRDSDINEKGVINCVSRLPCRITKLGWLDDERFKDLTSSIATFLSRNMATCNKGLLVLSVFIDEIDSEDEGSIKTPKQRKISSDFRDKELLNIFVLSIEVLKRILADKNFSPNELNDNSFVENALHLTYKCINFDFIGTLTNESSFEFNTLQIPSKWVKHFSPSFTDNNDGHVIKLVWNILISLINSKTNDSYKYKCISKCLQLLNSFALVRKSLFPEDKTKIKYYSLIIDGTLLILNQYAAILNDIDVFNSFCRLLISVKNNCQINTLIQFPNYELWIDSIAKFTAESFKLHSTTSNGIHFLLQLWSKFTMSITYFRGKTPNFMKTFVPEITLEFLQSNLNHLCQQIKEGNDFDSLLSEVEMTSIYEFLPQLFLFDYEKSVAWVRQKFEGHISQLQSVANGSIRPDQNTNKHLQVIEVEVAWLIYVIATVISGNLPIGVNKEKFKNLDANLCSLAFQIVPYSTFRAEMQMKTGIEATPLLERALLSFFANFQRSYIQLYISRPVLSMNDNEIPFFKFVGEALNKEINQQSLMNLILSKLLGNLCFWHKNKVILNESLEILKSISNGYESFKIACASPIIENVLKNHFCEFCTFLDYPQNQKFRTIFYQIFSKFVFTEECEVSMEHFLSPFDKTFAWLAAQADYNSPEVVRKIIGLCRDLRGICRACIKKNNYEEFFDWIHGNHFGTYLMLFEVLSMNPEAAISMLRFLEEFVLNRGARISFGASSVSGLSLFYSTQKALSTYGSRLSGMRISDVSNDADIYNIKIKGITITMSILSRILCGNYVPFGAFEYYRDNSLKQIVGNITGLVFSVPLELLYSYTKMALNYYEMVEIFFSCHIELVCNLPDQAFSTILTSIYDGVQSTNQTHSLKAANALDFLCTFIVVTRNKLKKPDFYEKLLNRMSSHTDMFLKLVSILFHFVLFENVPVQYALTRALNSLLIFHPRLLEYYAKVLIEAQPAEHVDRMRSVFEEVIQVVAKGKVSGAMRDKFNRAVVSLKLHVANVSVVPVF